jgi:hypothetical protein
VLDAGQPLTRQFVGDPDDQSVLEVLEQRPRGHDLLGRGRLGGTPEGFDQHLRQMGHQRGDHGGVEWGVDVGVPVWEQQLVSEHSVLLQVEHELRRAGVVGVEWGGWAGRHGAG